MAGLTLAQETADALARRVQADLSAVVIDAMPGISEAEAMQRADALAWEFPVSTLMMWLEAHRIRLAVKALKP